MRIRKILLQELLETGVVHVTESRDEEGGLHHEIRTTEEYYGAELPLDMEGLLDLCSAIAAEADVVYRFWFDPRHEYNWHGGVYMWQPAIPLPTTEEEREKFNEAKIPISRIEGPWLREDPDFTIIDKEFSNLMIQLFTTLFTLVHGNDDIE